jgi:hypothetical protein
MKPIASAAKVFCIVTALLSAPTWAQPQTSAPAPATTAIAAAATSSEDAKAAEPRKSRRWLKADARVCLEFPNDMQIIKCSEKYR